MAHAEDFKPVLESLLKDASPQVRSQALRSLMRIKRQPKPGEMGIAAVEVADAAVAEDTAPPEPAADATPQPAEAVPDLTPASSPEVVPISADRDDKG